MRNGDDWQITPRRRKTAQIRAKIMMAALRNGEISNVEAKKVTGLPQVWFHLAALVHTKYLIHTDYNIWKPRDSEAALKRTRRLIRTWKPRRGRPRQVSL